MSKGVNRRRFLRRVGDRSRHAGLPAAHPSVLGPRRLAQREAQPGRDRRAAAAARRTSASVAGEMNIVALCDVDDEHAGRGRQAVPEGQDVTPTSARCSTSWTSRSTRWSSARPTTPTPPAAVDGHEAGQALLLREAADPHGLRGPRWPRLAKKNKLATQMGTQIHAGDNYRRVVELVQAGAIGPVADYTRHLLFPEEKFKDFQLAAVDSPVDRPSQGMARGLHDQRPDDLQLRLLRRADRGMLSGMVAYRVGEKLQWDAENLKVVNCPKAESLIAGIPGGSGTL